MKRLKKESTLNILFMFFLLLGYPGSVSALVDYWPEDSWVQWRRDPAKNAFNSVSTVTGATPQLLWKYQTGPGSSNIRRINTSAAVVNGKVFIGGNDGVLYCLKQVTNNINGELVWKYQTWQDTLQRRPIRSSPAVAYNRVFFAGKLGDTNAYIFCLNENPPGSGGELLWKYYIGPTNTMISSPVVVNGKVYIGSETGYIYCFNALTDNPNGELLWQHDCVGWFHSSLSVANGKIYGGTSDNRLWCLNAETGDSIWMFQGTDTLRGIFPTPAVANNRVYFSSDDGWTRCFDATNGIPVWQRYITIWDGPSAAVAYNRVFKTYENYGSIICWLAQASDSGVKIWEYDFNAADRTGPAVADNKVMAINWSDSLYCFDALANSANKIWSYYIPTYYQWPAPGSAPSIANGLIFIGDRDGYVHALRAPGGNLPPIAYASAIPDSGQAPLVVNFTGSGIDLDGFITSYFWRFGDGDSSFDQNPVHNYITADYYIASLRVTDNQGANNEATVFIEVTESGHVRDKFVGHSTPDALSLEICPNPFRNALNIKHQIPSTKFFTPLDSKHPTGQANLKSQISIKVYDASGRLVRQWDYQTMRQCDEIVWHGDDDLGLKLPAGVYFISLVVEPIGKAGDYKETKKVILLR